MFLLAVCNRRTIDIAMIMMMMMMMTIMIFFRYNEHGGSDSDGFSGGSEAGECTVVAQHGAAISRCSLPPVSLLYLLLVTGHLRTCLRTLHRSAAVMLSSL